MGAVTHSRPTLLSRSRRHLQWLHAQLLIRVVSKISIGHEINSLKTLIVAPHQDDETLGCGGVIAEKTMRGAQVSIAFLTDGREGANLTDRLSRQQLIEMRKREAISAASSLNVDVNHLYFFDCADGTLSNEEHDPNFILVKKISSLLKELQVAEVYAPHRRDRHPDHEAAYRLTLSAIRHESSSVRVFQYPIWLWWSSPVFVRSRPSDFKGSRIVAGTAYGRHCKSMALRSYRSQIDRFTPGFLDSFRNYPEVFFECRIH